MFCRRTHLLIAFGLLASAACVPPVPRHAPSAVAPRPQVPRRTPISFIEPAGIVWKPKVRYALDVPDVHDWEIRAWTPVDGARLYVHAGVERWLFGPSDDSLVTTHTLLPEPALAIGLVHDRLRMIAASGAAYSFDSPLGELTHLEGASFPVRGAAIGANAFVVIDGAGNLLRSTTLGQKWESVMPAVAQPILQVVMSPTGSGLALSDDRLFASTDDGATWTSQRRPWDDGFVENDVDGAPIFRDRFGWTGIRFEARPAALMALTEVPLRRWDPLYDVIILRGGCIRAERTSVSRTLVGAHVLELDHTRDPDPEWRTSIHDLTATKIQLAGPALGRCSQASLASFGDAVVATCGYAEKGTNDVPIVESNDGGETWRSSSLKLAAPHGIEQLAMGPGGFLLVVPWCVPPLAGFAECDNAPLLRGAAGKPFVDTGWAPQFPVAVTFSKDQKRVYALAMRGGSLRLFGGPIGLSKLGPIGKELLRPQSYEPHSVALTIASNGDFVAGVCEWDSCGVFHSADDGKSWTRAATVPGRGQIALYGDRGLMSEGWETADGGLTWSPVQLPQYPRYGRDLQCNALGCVSERAERRGWELDGP